MPASRRRPGAGTGAGAGLWQLTAVTFLTLVSEPLFLLADSAIVGHLGTTELAALGIAAGVLGVVISVCIFLAYGTTAAVARLVGAGEPRAAYTQGMDGIWLAVAGGTAITACALPLTGRIVDLFGPAPDVAGPAADYLRVALLGTVPMLVVLAATGVLRGVKDVRTPLAVAVAGNLVNIVLNYLLVYPAGLGLRGSAIGTVIAQALSAIALSAVVVIRARHARARLRPDRRGIGRAMRIGVPLIVRTVMLRAALLLMTYGAAGFGSTDLAAMQLALTIWTFLAFALDALGISAQTLVGQELGRGSAAEARRLTGHLIRAGWWLGAATGVLLAACAGILGPLFTGDQAVLDLLRPALLVAALAQPVAGVVFTLDGILIGAGDGPFLAWAQTAVLAVFAPLAWWAITGPATLTWLWLAFAVGFMGARGAILLARARGETWLRLGAA